MSYKYVIMKRKRSTNFQIFLLVLSCVVLMVNASHGIFQNRTNIIIVVDVEKPYTSDILKNVWVMLDGISLRDYRIALFSTNGVSQPLIDYQTRQCTINKLRLAKRLRYRRLSIAIKEGRQEIFNQFRDDENILVVLTESSLDPYSKYLLRTLKLRSKNLENYIIRSEESSFTMVTTNNRTIREHLKTFDSVLYKLPFYKLDTNACILGKNGESNVTDQCSRQCECVDGRLVNCARLRTQFSTLPLSKRIEYINAYKTLATDPRYQEAFYEHIKIHPTVDFEVLHSKQQLLAFHRKYTLVFENMLRLIDCRLTIPYWNFALHAKHLFKKIPGYHMWDNIGGFGSTNTSIKNGFCIETGPFKYPEWKLPLSYAWSLNEQDRFNSICEDVYTRNKKMERKCNRKLFETFQPQCLTRFHTKMYTIPTLAQVFHILHSNKTTFKKFEEFLRLDCHGSIHDNMGGDFGYGYSSNLPEFFPLHSMLDAMWDYWQHKGKGDRYFGHWQKDKKFKIIGYHTPRYWYLDNNNLELCGVRIKYTSIFPKGIIDKGDKEMKSLEINRIFRNGLTVEIDDTDMNGNDFEEIPENDDDDDVEEFDK